jgi:hypothetical protein
MGNPETLHAFGLRVDHQVIRLPAFVFDRDDEDAEDVTGRLVHFELEALASVGLPGTLQRGARGDTFRRRRPPVDADADENAFAEVRVARPAERADQLAGASQLTAGPRLTDEAPAAGLLQGHPEAQLAVSPRRQPAGSAGRGGCRCRRGRRRGRGRGRRRRGAVAGGRNQQGPGHQSTSYQPSHGRQARPNGHIRNVSSGPATGALCRPLRVAAAARWLVRNSSLVRAGLR